MKVCDGTETRIGHPEREVKLFSIRQIETSPAGGLCSGRIRRNEVGWAARGFFSIGGFGEQDGIVRSGGVRQMSIAVVERVHGRANG